jgi:hypothetical protein
MRRLWLLIVLIVGLLSVTVVPARAEGDWRINRFHSDIAVQPDGRVKVTETIDVDFGSVAKHGIFRDIPYQYQSDDKTWYTTIDIWSVERDGSDEPYQLNQTNGYQELKIGRSNKTITGQHQYRLTYFATGVLQAFDGYDELYWNVTGDQWDASIDQASATVTLPHQGIVQLACYEGQSGSTDTCPYTTLNPMEARFSATGQLSPGSGLTVAVGYTKDMVPILTVAEPEATTDFLIETGQQPFNWLLALMSAVLGLGLPVALWWRKGRDWWWQQPGMLGGQQSVQLKPWFGQPQVIVEFTPPEQLRPAQLGLLLDQKVDTLDVTSTIVDLASRGFLTIKELPKTWILGSADYQLQRTDQSDEPLLPYEKLLLQRLFAGGKSVNLASLKNTFYDDLREVQQRVYDNLSGVYFTSNPSKIRTRYALLGAALMGIGVVVAWWAANQHLMWPIIVAIMPLAAGIGVIALSSAMPQRTAWGYDVYRRALGYKQFIATAEQYRQQFFEQQNLFNQVLPYAMVLGLTHKFAEAMKQIGYVPAQPGWYSGQTAFNLVAFSHGLGSMSKAMNSAMASRPSGSGSGGGGFSGGGFGGGGGGSW